MFNIVRIEAQNNFLEVLIHPLICINTILGKELFGEYIVLKFGELSIEYYLLLLMILRIVGETFTAPRDQVQYFVLKIM